MTRTWPLLLLLLLLLAGAFLLSACRQSTQPHRPAPQSAGRTFVGVGLVTGLSGTGDGDTPALRKLLAAARPNRTFDGDDLRDWALVAVVARVSDADQDVAVHSIGTATSLKGGTLLRTPLNDQADPTRQVFVEGPLVLRPDSAFTARLSRPRAGPRR